MHTSTRSLTPRQKQESWNEGIGKHTRWQTLLQLIGTISLCVVHDQCVQVLLGSDLEFNLVLAWFGGFLDSGGCKHVLLACVFSSLFLVFAGFVLCSWGMRDRFVGSG